MRKCFFNCVICVAIIFTGSLSVTGCSIIKNENLIIADTTAYTRVYETGDVVFVNNNTFEIEYSGEDNELQKFVAFGEANVVTHEQAQIINCPCYPEGERYVLIYVNLPKETTIHYAWVADMNDDIDNYNYGYFDSRINENKKKLSPFRVTFEDPARPYLKFDNIRGKICVVDFTSFFD